MQALRARGLVCKGQSAAAPGRSQGETASGIAVSANQQKLEELRRRAAARLAGGVNSPVRAWKAVGGQPLFMAEGAGATLVDCAGVRYIDYVGGFGPAIVGHAHRQVVEAVAEQVRRGFAFGASTELEVELAEVICRAVAGAEKVRLVSSGTEAAMTALRIARAATGRPAIVKFDGCYHGHSDALLVRAGSGAMTFAMPDSAGVPQALAGLTRVAAFNSLADVERCFAADPEGIAAVIVETVPANMGVVAPARGFLAEVGRLARRHGALLICDEVITGFRLRFGAACELYEAKPDLILLGKIIGGGMPVGAVAGPAALLERLAPAGDVYQAGTLSGNPVAMRAGLETLRLLARPGVYEHLERMSARLAEGLAGALAGAGVPGCVNRVGSMLTLFHGVGEVRNAEEARAADLARFNRFFHGMLRRGIYLAPSQFEAMFVSLAHGPEEIERTVAAAEEVLAEARVGLKP
jgi:glutamate-1-semialdehyde 2,1-aminomutase